MTGAILALLIGVPSFFFGIYRASHSSPVPSLAWTFLSLIGLAAAAGGVLRLSVPGFFEGIF